MSFATLLLLVGAGVGSASEADALIEKSMSDTLDTWRAGQYEQLFEQLASRGTTTRESFVKKMRGSSTRPACCWQRIRRRRVQSRESQCARRRSRARANKRRCNAPTPKRRCRQRICHHARSLNGVKHTRL